MQAGRELAGAILEGFLKACEGSTSNTEQRTFPFLVVRKPLTSAVLEAPNTNLKRACDTPSRHVRLF